MNFIVLGNAFDANALEVMKSLDWSAFMNTPPVPGKHMESQVFHFKAKTNLIIQVRKLAFL